MRRAFPILCALTLAIGIVPTASAALTTTYPSEGGIWYHGFDSCSIASSCTQSIYVHQTKAHHATAVGKTTVRRSAAAGGVASAIVAKALLNNQTYYGLGL